jgi:uroporphyrinogen decarboxylase
MASRAGAKNEMNKRERVRAALMGEDVDRVPVSFWGHDYLREFSAEDTAAATLEFQERWDLDLVKVNPRATYYVEAWGSEVEPSNDATKGPEIKSFGIEVAEDLLFVDIADPGKGPFEEQLIALDIIGKALDGKVPLVQTVFSPLAVLGRLTDGGPKKVKQFMEEDSAAVHQALDSIAETLAAYSRTCVEIGADGVFFATVDWGTKNMMSKPLYMEYGRPYDLRVLAAVRGAPLNILHVCRSNNLLDMMLDYPVGALNWDARAAGNPSLKEIHEASGRGVIGGIGQDQPMSSGKAAEVKRQAADAIREMGRKWLVLAAGCSISPQTPDANIRAALSQARAA